MESGHRAPGTLLRVQSLEELRWRYFQLRDDFQDVDQGQVVLTALDASHVTAVDAASISERLLGVAQGLAVPTHSNAKTQQIRMLLG